MALVNHEVFLKILKLYQELCSFKCTVNRSVAQPYLPGSVCVILVVSSLIEQISEAISELEGIKEKRDVILCSCMALIIAHKRTKMVDKETVKQLEVKLKSERTTCGETALYFAGMFLFHSGRPEKAKEYIERMLKMAPQSKEVTLMIICIFFFLM